MSKRRPCYVCGLWYDDPHYLDPKLQCPWSFCCRPQCRNIGHNWWWDKLVEFQEMEVALCGGASTAAAGGNCMLGTADGSTSAARVDEGGSKDHKQSCS